MKSACFTTHTSRDNTYSPRVHPETSLSCGFRPPPTVLVFPLTVLRGTLHQLHHASLVLLLLHLQHLQFSLFIFCTPPLKYSPTRAHSCFFGFFATSTPAPCTLLQQQFGCGGCENAPPGKRISQTTHDRMMGKKCAICHAHRIRCVGVSDSLFSWLWRTRVRRRPGSLILTGSR